MTRSDAAPKARDGWEYMTVVPWFDARGYPRIAFINGKRPIEAERAEPSDFFELMDQFGAEGWELTSTLGSAVPVALIFKRRRTA